MLKQQKAILTFWRDIEIFNLPDLPDDVILYKSGSKLPWHTPDKTEKKYNYQYTVFLGKLSKKEVTERIEEAIGYIPDQEETWLEEITGKTCMAAMVVDEFGHTSHDNGYLQAAFIHGLKALQKKQSLANIEAELEKEQELFKERFPANAEATSKKDLQTTIINWSHLIKELRILNSLGIDGLVADLDIWIKQTKVAKEAKPEVPFMNSFYQKDLNKLIDAQGKWGKGLLQFLSLNTTALPKVDLLNNAEAFWQAIDPKDIPAGRWPSNPEHGLYSAQLGAVNTCLTDLKNQHGLIGVNGPPGTGKTTLLADIVAEAIVNRGLQLMKGNIQTLFGKKVTFDKGDEMDHYYLPDAKLFEHAGIVVASNNNAAVENISKELPAALKIDLKSFPSATYFTPQATQLIPGESWGVLAAALGNSENKAAFKSNFWYSEEEKKSRDKDQPLRVGFGALLTQTAKNDQQISRYLGLYDAVKAELKELHQQFDTFKSKATAHHASLALVLKDKKILQEEEENLSRHQTALEWVNEEKITALTGVRDLKIRRNSIYRSLNQHQTVKPSLFFFQQLFKTDSFKSWRKTEQFYFADLEEVNEALNVAQRAADSKTKQFVNAQTDLEDTARRLNIIHDRLANYKRAKQALHLEYGIALANIPDEEFLGRYLTDKAGFHTATPWSSMQLNTLRSNIFLLSLKLQEYAILSNAKFFNKNLNLFLDYQDRKVQISSALAEILWKTLFFCIPVVSTTLASVSKIFGPLGKESIGWLLMDEAGQAVPLAAAGLINRAQKSVIIGDPLQIEPVVTLNHQLIQILAAESKTDPLWSPLHNSAQTLADRVSVKGAWMTDSKNEETWTGFPLRAHRRCNNPMFAIANQIAYSNQMVKAVPDVVFDCILGDSAWFDVAGVKVENKQVIIEEINLLKEKIALLKDTDAEVFIISPFKSVADHCKEVFKSSKVKCGTIHTFQGKEADIVFLVLGSDPAKPGARAWASKKPNMLNVALTRSKKRLYVIGNRKLWKGNQFFSTLAKEL